MRRFTIAAMMAVVLVCGVAIAALRNASEAWVGVMLMLTLGLLGVAVLGAIERRDAGRSFCRGFAIFGGAYLTLAMGPWFAERVGARLPTSRVLDYLHAKAQPDQLSAGLYQVVTQKVSPGSSDVAFEAVPPGLVSLTLALKGGTTLDQFLHVGHCLFALMAGLVGGLIAHRFHRTAAAP